MKKIILGISLFSLVLLTLAFFSSAASATEGPENNDIFHAKTELKKSKCTNAVGKPVISITQKVKNDLDSGFGSTVWWAFDYYKRYIEVWSTGENTYCAIVKYDGEFYAVPGQVGPGDNPSGALIDSPVHGDMDGGYRATFNGTLTPGPWVTNGNVGTTNYLCNIVTSNCTGKIDWIGQYFPGYSAFDMPWWGWKYKKEGHGIWINAIDVLQPDSGNIL